MLYPERERSAAPMRPTARLINLDCDEASPPRQGDLPVVRGCRVALRLRARSFLHHQVRYIAATLVEVGLGKRCARPCRQPRVAFT
eukprot:4418501-Pleurochrysis_carterae.AAC.2